MAGRAECIHGQPCRFMFFNNLHVVQDGIIVKVSTPLIVRPKHVKQIPLVPEREMDQCHPKLLHGGEKIALGDSGYQGVEKRDENKGKSVTWHVAMKPTRRKALADDETGKLTELMEYTKTSIRAPGVFSRTPSSIPIIQSPDAA